MLGETALCFAQLLPFKFLDLFPEGPCSLLCCSSCLKARSSCSCKPSLNGMHFFHLPDAEPHSTRCTLSMATSCFLADTWLQSVRVPTVDHRTSVI